MVTGSAWWYLAAGAGAAIIGLLPWLATGMRLPLQNLWEVRTLPEDMPIALLPFSQYGVALLAGVMVIGSAVAGIFARVMRARLPRYGLAAIVAGVIGLQSVAVVQTAVTVAGGLRESTASELYLSALVAGTTVAMLVGVGVFFLVARAPVPGAMVGLSIAAVLSASWLGGVGPPFGNLPFGVSAVLLSVFRWAPAVAVALALVWSGLHTIARVCAAIASLLLLWVVPAAIIAVSAAVGSRVLLPRPAELLEFAQRLFLLELGPEGRSIPLVLTAVILTVLGLSIRWWVQRHRSALAA